MKINCVKSAVVLELLRGIRFHYESYVNVSELTQLYIYIYIYFLKYFGELLRREVIRLIPFRIAQVRIAIRSVFLIRMIRVTNN